MLQQSQFESDSPSVEERHLDNPSSQIDCTTSLERQLSTVVDWHPNGATHLRANGAT